MFSSRRDRPSSPECMVADQCRAEGGAQRVLVRFSGVISDIAW